MSAARDLLTNYQHIIEELTLVTGSSGVFDVTVDGELLFSKDATCCHAESGEVLKLFAVRYGAGVRRYGT